MRYKPWDIIDLLRTPVGRSQLASAWNYLAFPVFEALAKLHRRLVVRKTRIICVVGSAGKTTTHGAVAAVLGLPQDGGDNRNSWSDVARRILRLRPGTRRAVIEAGIAQPGQMRRYATMTRPDVTVVTSVCSDHNRSLPTLEITREEKAAMVRILPCSGTAVLNGDDPNVLWMKGQTRARIVTFGFDPSNDVRADDFVMEWPHGSRFMLHMNGQSWVVRSRLIGRHMVHPLLAAMAVAWVEGADLDAALVALETIPPVHGRMEQIPLDGGAWVLGDDLKSPLEGIHAALEALAQIPARRRIVVFSGITEPPGNQHHIHRELGRRVAQAASRAFFLGGSKLDNCVKGAVRAGMPREAITHVAGMTVCQISELLRAELGEGDVVLVKGRTSARLRRIILALQGRQVRCNIAACHVKTINCDQCVMLERGWDGLHAVT